MEIIILKILWLISIIILIYFGYHYGIKLRDIKKFGFDDTHIKGTPAFILGLASVLLGLYALYASFKF